MRGIKEGIEERKNKMNSEELAFRRFFSIFCMGFVVCCIVATIVGLVIFGDEELSNQNNQSNEFQQKLNQKAQSSNEETKQSLSQEGTLSPLIVTTPKEPVQVYSATVEELYSELDANAIIATENYKNKYVAVTGILSSIDNEGKRFSLRAQNGGAFESVLVSVPKEQREKTKQELMRYSEGNRITVTGKMTVVGEFLGYSMEIGHPN